MIMRNRFNRPPAKILTLCICLGITTLLMAGCGSREERAQAYYEAGKSYLEKKEYAKARIEFRNALQRKADMLPALQGLAEIDEHERNMQALAGTLRRITELAPNDLAAKTKLARLYVLGNAPDQALKLANAAGEIDPQNADILALKAAILYRLKDVDGATRAAQAALAIDGANTSANTILAGIQYTRGDSEGALKTLANVPKEHTDDLGVIFLKIDIFNKKGDLAQAEALLRKLIELHPEVGTFRTKLIQFYLQHKRQEDAVNELRSAARANPADTKTELELVSLLAAIKGPDAARDELLTRIKTGTGAFPYQIALAQFDSTQGRAEDSIKLLQQLIAHASSTDETLLAKNTLANLYLSQNNIAAAEPLVTEILRADARNINGLRLRADIRLRRGQIDDAIADLRSALNDQPRSSELLGTLATAYERNGSIELAGKAYFDAMKASGFLPPAGLAYVAFLERRSATTQAESVLTDLANRNPSSVPVLSALARVKLSKQDWVGAHAIANAIKRLGDKGDLADQINAAAFSGQGKISDSLAVIQNAYEANPGAIRPMAELVRAYLRAGQKSEAEAFIRSVLTNNPDNAEALVLMGSIQLAKNAQAQAETYFKRAIEKKPTDVVGYRALAQLYTQQRKIDDALRIIRAGLKQQPEQFCASPGARRPARNQARPRAGDR